MAASVLVLYFKIAIDLAFFKLNYEFLFMVSTLPKYIYLTQYTQA